MNRKEFITRCSMACFAGTTLAWLQSCAALNYYAVANKSDKQLVIKRTEFINASKNKTLERKYVLIKTEEFNFPICVYKINEFEYSALLMECTHKSCELQPHGDYLVCPCHGSEFTKQGLVQNPPAEQDLKTFKTTSDEENIYIQF